MNLENLRTWDHRYILTLGCVPFSMKKILLCWGSVCGYVQEGQKCISAKSTHFLLHYCPQKVKCYGCVRLSAFNESALSWQFCNNINLRASVLEFQFRLTLTMDNLFDNSFDFFLSSEDIKTKFEEQYMHPFLQPLDIVLTAWHSDQEIKMLKDAIKQLTSNYNEMCNNYYTWLSNHKHSIGVDHNKTVDVHTI